MFFVFWDILTLYIITYFYIKYIIIGLKRINENMEFNKLELEYLELFKEVNSDFAIRMTPKFSLNKSVVEGRFLKMSDSLKRKGYE